MNPCQAKDVDAEKGDWIVLNSFLIWGSFNHAAAININGGGGSSIVLKANRQR